MTRTWKRWMAEVPERDARRDPRGGFALAVAIFGLVVVAVLTTGGFYVARQESRVGVAAERSVTALYLAERGVADVLESWDGDGYSRMATWSSTKVPGASSQGVWSVELIRVAPFLYFLESDAEVTRGEGVYGRANRTVGVVARLRSAAIDPRAALSTVGDLTIGGSSSVVGTDVEPGGWSALCDPVGPAKPGILIDSLSNISREGKSHTVEGDPAITEDNTLTSDSLLTFGDQEWEDLVALADLVFAPNSHVTQTHPDSLQVNGSWICDASDKLNWGDPYDPKGACGSYFPVIYAQGDFLVDASDYGQGIMLVEGDLTVKGGFEFYGPVIVRGTLITEGTGGHFNGGVIAANIALNTSSVLGAALVQYSSCAVQRAILNSALTKVRPLAQRSWVDLSVVGGSSP